MQIVIDIDEEEYQTISENKGIPYDLSPSIGDAILNGTVLPEHHTDDMLDEIKAEIEKLDGVYVLRDYVFYAEKNPKDKWFWYVRLKEVIDIINKYKESEK